MTTERADAKREAAYAAIAKARQELEAEITKVDDQRRVRIEAVLKSAEELNRRIDRLEGRPPLNGHANGRGTWGGVL